VELRPGFRLVCHPLAYAHSYRLQRDDPEQAAEFDAFVARCTPAMTLFDVGSHFGLFSLAALHYGGPSARAVAVDASPTACAFTRTQARLNGVAADRLTVVRACACEQEGERGMVAVGVLSDGYYTAPKSDHDAKELTVTPAVSLDGLVARTGVRPTHLKIDVEGYEGAVLAGGRGLLGGDRPPLVFLELHNALLRARGEDPAAVLRLLQGHGYRFVGPDGVRADDAGPLVSREIVRLVAEPVARHGGGGEREAGLLS
jgi:FkbM family methyltransferase